MNRDELIDEVKYLRQDVADLTAQLQKAEQDKESIRLVLKEWLSELENTAKYSWDDNIKYNTRVKLERIKQTIKECGITD